MYTFLPHTFLLTPLPHHHPVTHTNTHKHTHTLPQVPNDWWRLATATPSTKPLEKDEILRMGNKVVSFLAILALSVNTGDKVLLFSQSVPTLNFIEMILQEIQWGNSVGIDCVVPGLRFARWKNNYNYYKITGSTSGDERQKMINNFNNKQTGKHVRCVI